MINRHFHPGKKTLAARRVAGLLMSGAAAGAMAVSGAGAYIVSAATWQENANRIFDYLTQDLGYTEAAACGIMANIRCESTFNPQAWNAGGGSYGLCQWTGGRYSRLRSWCGSNGYDYTTIEGQLAYLEYELNAHYPGVEEYLRSVDNTADGAYEAGQYYCYHFEAPASRGSVSVYRGGLARGTFWETYRPAEWYKVDGVWHYILRDGSYQTEWLTIEDETFYLDEDGNRITGWRTIDGDRYYFADDGVMVTGWQKIDGKSYYFGQDGSLVTGLVRSGDDWFLLDQTGHVQASAAMEAFAPVWIAEAQERDAVLAETEPEETETLASASQDSSSASQESSLTQQESLSASQESASTSQETASISQESPEQGTAAASFLLAARSEADAAKAPGSGLPDGSSQETPASTDLPAPTAIEALQQAARQAAGRTQDDTAFASAHAVSSMTEEAATMAVAEALASAANATSTAVPEMTESGDDTSDHEEEPSSANGRYAENRESEEIGEAAEHRDRAESGEATENEEKTPAADPQEGENISFASAAEAMMAAAQTLQENKKEDDSGDSLVEEPQAELTADAAVKTEEEQTPDSPMTAEEAELPDSPASMDAETEAPSESADAAESDTEHADSVTSEEEKTDSSESARAGEEEQDPDTKSDSSDSDSVDENDEESEPLRIRFLWIENYEKDREKEKGKGLEKEIPSISLEEIDDLVTILHERELLLAETRQGKDITSEMTASFEEEVNRPGDYTVTFRVKYAGESLEKETTIHIVK